MPYAFVQDVPASWEQYRHTAAVLAETEPAGLILHLAGPTDEGYRIIAVWESKDAWLRFDTESLAPVLASLAGPPRPAPTMRELRPAHLILGAQKEDA